MTKKSWLILIIIFIILGGAAGVYAKFFAGQKPVSPVGEIQPTSQPAEELITWTDQSEFSFQYPKSLRLDPHDDDSQNYAHVELKSDNNPGNLIVWAKDTTAKDIEDWIKREKIEGAIDSLLGGEEAIKVLASEKDGSKKLTITTIRNGYLYQIEVNSTESDYWNKVYETVYTSFKFSQTEKKANTKNTTNSSAAQQESAGEEIFEGEEVIE